MKLDVKADLRAVSRMLGKLEKDASVAVSRAMNSAIRKARTVAVNEISKEHPGIKKENIRDAMKARLSHKDRLKAELIALGHRVPIIDQKARATRTGVTYRSKHGRRMIPGAFIATMKNGHIGVFKRKGQWDPKNGKRLPIVELRGLSIPRTFTEAKVDEAVAREARKQFEKELQRQIALMVKQAG